MFACKLLVRCTPGYNRIRSDGCSVETFYTILDVVFVTLIGPSSCKFGTAADSCLLIS